MKHIIEYNREEIIKCLKQCEDTFYDDLDTEYLRQLLSDLIMSGDAPELEYFNEVIK